MKGLITIGGVIVVAVAIVAIVKITKNDNHTEIPAMDAEI